jgi:hypothetical protein
MDNKDIYSPQEVAEFIEILLESYRGMEELRAYKSRGGDVNLDPKTRGMKESIRTDLESKIPKNILDNLGLEPMFRL